MARQAESSRILIFGGTGYIGKHLVRASISLGHPTYVYTRPAGPWTQPSNLDFHSAGVHIIEGELEEHEKIVATLKQVDIVISALPYPQVADQLKIIDAIVAAGNIKGTPHPANSRGSKPWEPHVLATTYVKPVKSLYDEAGIRTLDLLREEESTNQQHHPKFLEKKRKIRRATEAAGIPFTFVAANCCAAYFVNFLLHPHDPRDDIVVYGTGEAKAVLNYEEDIGKYTIKVANDPRACNRVVSYRPKPNIISQHELISQWEEKTGRTFKRVYVPEEDLVKLSQTLPPPENIPVSILHSVFVKGDLMSHEINEDDLEASRLYPEMQFTTMYQLLDVFLTDPPEPAMAAFG
ncbi:hypothetical protein BT93_J1188 [Corymbia citriodora subsp. variegata]|nr:hypothetical protein BT93_J1188 [Corymbia citriodora subsp. variegata]